VAASVFCAETKKVLTLNYIAYINYGVNCAGKESRFPKEFG